GVERNPALAGRSAVLPCARRFLLGRLGSLGVLRLAGAATACVAFAAGHATGVLLAGRRTPTGHERLHAAGAHAERAGVDRPPADRAVAALHLACIAREVGLGSLAALLEARRRRARRHALDGAAACGIAVARPPGLAALLLVAGVARAAAGLRLATGRHRVGRARGRLLL